MSANDIEVIEIKGQDGTVVVTVPGAGGGGPGGGEVALPPYVFIQSIPSAVWGPIAHQFGFRPVAVAVFSLDYTTQYAEFNVQHFDVNSLRLGMETPVSGVALIR